MGLFNIQETQCSPLHGLDPMNPSSRFFLCPSCNRVLPGFVLQIACQPILQMFHHLFVQAVLGREHKKRPTCSDEFPQPVGTRRLESREKISRMGFCRNCFLFTRLILPAPALESSLPARWHQVNQFIPKKIAGPFIQNIRTMNPRLRTKNANKFGTFLCKQA